MNHTAFPATPSDVAILTVQEFTFDLDELDGNRVPSMERVCRTFMGKGFLSLATATILNAVSNGYSFGFDIVDITGMPGGTVYPALRRLEDAGYLTSEWEKKRVAHAELRPRRRYYEITRAGRQALAEAAKRYRLLDQAQLTGMREPKSSRA